MHTANVGPGQFTTPILPEKLIFPSARRRLLSLLLLLQTAPASASDIRGAQTEGVLPG